MVFTFSTQDIVYITAESVVAFVTVAGNIIVLIAILKNKSLHTITNVFIGNLAVADIAVGFCVAPCAALSFLGLPKNKYGCIFINSAILMFTNISILMLLTIAIERFVAIRFPYSYKQYATVKVAVLVNLSIWVTGFLLGSLPLMGWNIAPDDLQYCAFTDIISMEYMVYFQFFAITLTPLIMILFIYLYIFSIVKKHTTQTSTIDNLFKNTQGGSRHSRTWQKDVKAARMFATLFLLFALFWLPVNILNTITLFCPSCNSPYQLLLTAIVLSHANSSVNPFLYAASNSRIKMAIRRLFYWRVVEDVPFDSNSRALPSNQSNRRRQSVPAIDAEQAFRNRSSHCSVESMDRLPSNKPDGDDDFARPNTTTRVTFMTEPRIKDHAPEFSVHKETTKDNVKDNGQPFKVSNHTLQHTHSFRDEIDNNILDRITPLEGIMANIYNSLDSETRDIIEGKSNCPDNHIQIDRGVGNRHTTDSHDRNYSPSCLPTQSSGRTMGLVNRGFVGDDDIHNENDLKDRDGTISFIEVGESTKYAVNPDQDSTPSHLKTTAAITKANYTPKLSRSSNVEYIDRLSNSISQESAVNNNDTTESAIPINTKILATGSGSNQMCTSGPPEYQNSRPHSAMLEDTQTTTQNLFSMEYENDDSIMSVKYFKESQDVAYSEAPCDDKGILKNIFSEVTHL